MGIFKKKDGKPEAKASKPAAKSAPAPKTVRVMKSKLTRIVKDVPTTRVPVSKLTRSFKTVSAPKMASDTAKAKPPMGLNLKSKSSPDTSASKKITTSSGVSFMGKSYKSK